MSKVLLVNPRYNFPVKTEMYPSGALLLLGTLAKNLGHDVELLHMVTDRLTDDDIAEHVRIYRIDVVAITVNTFQVKSAKRLISAIKQVSGARVVIGGAHPSSVGIDEARREFPQADDIIIGEGEFPFLSILENRTITKPDDLEYVTHPDLSLVNHLSRFIGAYPLGRSPAMFLMASRGCPNQCTFCNRAIFGNKVRYRSPENVLKELGYFAGRGIKEVFIQDDTFNLNRAWYEEILQRIIAEGLHKRMSFRAPFRADCKLVDRKVLDLAKKAGFWLLFYGVENGNQGMLDRMHKRLSLEEVERAVRLSKEAGLKVETSFIIGLPGETVQTVSDTARFYRKLAPFWSGCGVAIPFPSTGIATEVREQIKDIPFEDYRPGKIYFRTDELDFDDISESHSRIERLMLHDKMVNMIGSPGVLLRTIRDRMH